MSHHPYALQRTKPRSAVWRVERIFGVTRGRLCTLFIGIPMLDFYVGAYCTIS